MHDVRACLGGERLEARVGRVNHFWAIHPNFPDSLGPPFSALLAPHVPLNVGAAYDTFCYVVYMLIDSRLWHIDAPCHHLSLSDIRAQGPRSKVQGAKSGHCRHWKSITALGSHFTGRYLPSFGSRKDAVVLTTFKQDVNFKQVGRIYLYKHFLVLLVSLRMLYFFLQVSQLFSAVGLPLFPETDFRTAIYYSFVVVAAYAPSSGRPNNSLRACKAYSVAQPGLVDVDGRQLIGFTR